MLKVKTTLINAEGQNNTYKKIKDMLKRKRIQEDTCSSGRIKSERTMLKVSNC